MTFSSISKNISKMFYVLQIRYILFWGIFERRLTVWGRPYNVTSHHSYTLIHLPTGIIINIKTLDVNTRHNIWRRKKIFRNCNMHREQSPTYKFFWNWGFLLFSKSFFMTASIGLLGILWLLLLLNLNCMNVFYLCKCLLLVCFTRLFFVMNYTICCWKQILDSESNSIRA